MPKWLPPLRLSARPRTTTCPKTGLLGKSGKKLMGNLFGVGRARRIAGGAGGWGWGDSYGTQLSGTSWCLVATIAT